jgi:hypothetical protein
VAGERVQNLLTLEVEYEPSKVPGHRFAGARLTEEVGAVATGMGVYELDPVTAAGRTTSRRPRRSG